MRAPRILAIHAHPDDVEFQCAGTLALCRRLGSAITIATMTPGDCGSAEHTAEEIAEIRRREAGEAARLLAGRAFTALLAGFAAKVVGSFVNGLIPLRAGRAGFLMTTNLAKPGTTKAPLFLSSL